MMQTFEHLENICFQTVTAIRSDSNTKQSFCMQKFEKRSVSICLRLEKERADDDILKCEYCKKAKTKCFCAWGVNQCITAVGPIKRNHGAKTTQFYA